MDNMNGHILIVEDDTAIRQLLAYLFENEGYKVTTAEDGQLAVDLATSLLPDVIILDLQLPVLNGLRVVEALRENAATHSISVIAVSAMPLLRNRAEELGVRACFEKPFELWTLVEVVRASLQRSHFEAAAGG